MTKYKSQAVYLDLFNNVLVSAKEVKDRGNDYYQELLYFASIHEYKVYRELLQVPNNLLIQKQPLINIIPPKLTTCYPKGKNWKADFLVCRNGKPLMLVEAKGVLTRDFAYILALLELYNPKLFNKLWLIFPHRIPKSLIIKRLQSTPMKSRITVLRHLKKNLIEQGIL